DYYCQSADSSRHQYMF
nr:immunoglobulin light chain junction region [Macaca mulatta]